MGDPPRSPHLASPVELKARIEAERRGRPMLIFRDAAGAQRIVELDRSPVTIGRDAGCAIALTWDERVSRLHAELQRIEDHWVLVDDGLSRNGTFVGGEAVVARRRLRDGDLVEIGGSGLVFRDPRERGGATTVAGREGAPPELTPAQRRVLVALCRPLGGGDRLALPATNQQVADELHLTVAAVKTHVRTLFARFAIPDLPHNEKRAALVRAALASGAVAPGELAEGGQDQP